MSLPQKQLDRLARDLQNHKRELEALERSPQKDDPSRQEEIEFHRAVLQTGQDSKILEVLGEIYLNADLVDQLESDPDTFLQSRGVKLPAKATKIVTRKIPQPIQAGIRFSSFILLWDREGGFGVHWEPSGS